MALAKDKQDLEQCRSNILCVSCRTPVREGAPLQQGVGAPLQAVTGEYGFIYSFLMGK